MTFIRNLKLEIKPAKDRFFLPLNNSFEPTADVVQPPETVIQGEVLVRLKRPLKVTSLTLKFEGYVEEKAFGVKSLKFLSQRYIVKEKIVFLQAPNGHQQLSAGTHAFNFSFALGSQLPETVHSPFLNVRYNLVAILKKPGFSTTVKQVKELSISRVSEVSDPDCQPAIVLANAWPKVLDYSVVLSNKILALEQTVPIEFHLWPHSPDIKFLGLEFYLVEEITYMNRSIEGTTNTKRWIKLKSISTLHDSMLTNKLVRVQIPPEARARCDINNEFIQIHHKLEVRILFENRRKLNSITLRCQVIVQPEPLIDEDLPSYMQSFQSQLVEIADPQPLQTWSNNILPAYEVVALVH
ncbi:hypothetical protein K493DRAFT_406962 [Basidiobolus meristosporus CBS 931.73]|uniref:Arrestin C-terminal-like domain-containing protein n=1 Tax=Basidiobolus meristosporus CBS 931.73 TaxID=1314790 RepID=A0A1Y1YH82_9FUNG|nr:hypothetical protein K493DRAFT_406962 [Basidiobolus meristosporus CBS 931.73]|eukprot:ORX97380.1 hypothetical protein K493DRAFT_406962 [Basidiobolus meristosporus CBS 931.73]